MKLMSRVVPLLLILILGGALSAHAQTNLSAFFGVGSAWDSATSGCVPYAYTPAPIATECNVAGDYYGPSMGGVFGLFGADFMFSHYLGVGGEYSWRFAQAPFADLNYRPNFYDFNVIYHPISGKVIPEIQGGIGGASIHFYLPNQCGTYGCSGSPYVASANHFQLHAAAALKVYIHGGLFVKPQFDIRYVTNLTQQFGRNWVPEVTGSVGYTFGEH